MSDFITIPGQTIIDQVPAFEDDGYTKKSGLVPSDFSITAWKDGVIDATPVTISEIGASGEYEVVYTPALSGYWLVEVHILFSHAIWESTAQVGIAADITALIERMDRVLGLLHYNSMLDKEIYDDDDQLVSCRLRVFNHEANVPAIPGGNEGVAQGMLHEYSIVATYVEKNRSNMYKLVKVV